MNCIYSGRLLLGCFKEVIESRDNLTTLVGADDAITSFSLPSFRRYSETFHLISALGYRLPYVQPNVERMTGISMSKSSVAA